VHWALSLAGLIECGAGSAEPWRGRSEFARLCRGWTAALPHLQARKFFKRSATDVKTVLNETPQKAALFGLRRTSMKMHGA
jgi:hypothetical protein